MSKQQAWILIVIAAAAVGALVQMNRYRYFEQTLGQAASAYILSIDRLTGQQCVVSVPVAPSPLVSRRLTLLSVLRCYLRLRQPMRRIPTVTA